MSIVVIVSAGALVIDSRLRSAIFAYVVFTVAALWLSRPQEHAITALVLFSFLALVKVVVGPAALIWLRRTYGVPDDLAPSLNIGGRLAAVLAALFCAHLAGQLPAFAGISNAALVFYCIAASICIVILHRNMLAHVVGLLALGSSITLAAAIFSPSLPGAVELADTFDAVIATLIAITIARAVIAHDPRLDIRSLRELRG